jgi:hypothetical protein
MTATRRKPTRPEPIRFRLVREFIESAKDIGDPAMVATARRIWWAVHFPRTRPCAPEEMEIFRDWCAGA